MERNTNREFEEKSAAGVRGCLLYNFITGLHFFRLYDYDNDTYEDYKICAEDINIEILRDDCSLFRTKTGGKLNWSSKTLGHKVAPGEVKLRPVIVDHKLARDNTGKPLIEQGKYGDDLEFVSD